MKFINLIEWNVFENETLKEEGRKKVFEGRY